MTESQYCANIPEEHWKSQVVVVMSIIKLENKVKEKVMICLSGFIKVQQRFEPDVTINM